MVYRCVTTSIAGFIQQLTVAYVSRGYYFYVSGVIPEHKDPAKTDRKLLDAYGIDVSKWTRVRRKRAGFANVHYLRHGCFYVLIASHGLHEFFAAEANRLHDIRRRPLFFMGHSIGCRRERGGGVYHASVRINRDLYLALKSRFGRAALECSVEQLYADFRALPFEPYAPVRNQLRGLLRAVNRRRSVAGLELVPEQALRLYRAPVRPFDSARTQVCAETKPDSPRSQPGEIAE